MKFDWQYVTKERAKVNIAVAASEVIKKLTEDRKTDQIVGVCLLMDALIATLGDDDD